MASRAQIGGLTGIIGGAIGAYMGYRQAIEVGIEPWEGALAFGLIGLILGGFGGFLLRTFSAIIVYAVLLAIVVYVFRGPIEAITDIDPIEAASTIAADVLAFLQGELAERRVD